MKKLLIILIIFLSLFLITSCKEEEKRDEEIGEKKEDVVIDTFFYGHDSKNNSELTYHFDQSLFSVSNTVYNIEIAKLAFCLTSYTSCYTVYKEQYHEHFIEIYKDFDSYEMSEDILKKDREDSFKWIISHKEFKDYTLLTFTSDGEYYYNQWINNLDFGLEDIHKEIYNLATIAYQKLLDYIEKHHLSNIKLLLTGASRGGSISQVLTYLINNENNELINKNNTYAYTFNAPKVFRMEVDNSNYQNIISIVDPYDLVGEFFPKTFGFKPIGQEIVMYDEAKLEAIDDFNDSFENQDFKSKVIVFNDFKFGIVDTGLTKEESITKVVKDLTLNKETTEAISFYQEKIFPILKTLLTIFFDNMERFNNIKIDSSLFINAITKGLISSSELANYVANILNKYNIKNDKEELDDCLEKLYELISIYNENDMLAPILNDIYMLGQNVNYLRMHHGNDCFYFYLFK